MHRQQHLSPPLQGIFSIGKVISPECSGHVRDPGHCQPTGDIQAVHWRPHRLHCCWYTGECDGYLLLDTFHPQVEIQHKVIITLRVKCSLNCKDIFDLKNPEAHPGVSAPCPEGESPEDGKVDHKYYQWVCFTLFFQAILFYLPRLLLMMMIPPPILLKSR